MIAFVVDFSSFYSDLQNEFEKNRPLFVCDSEVKI